MNCSNHTNKEAVTRCNKCGIFICEDCAVTVNSETLCKSCVAEMASHNARGANNPRFGGVPPHGMPMPRRDINGFFLFCLSVIPGLNYMYMGLMKRGMFFMSTFFMLMFLTIFFQAPVLMFVVIIEMCYSFFDGFAIRRKLLANVPVNDDVEDILPFFIRNKSIILFGFLALIFLSFLNSFSYMIERICYNIFGYGISSNVFSSFIGLCIVGAGIFIIYNGFFKNKNKDYENNNNNNDQTRQ